MPTKRYECNSEKGEKKCIEESNPPWSNLSKEKGNMKRSLAFGRACENGSGKRFPEIEGNIRGALWLLEEWIDEGLWCHRRNREAGARNKAKGSTRDWGAENQRQRKAILKVQTRCKRKCGWVGVRLHRVKEGIGSWSSDRGWRTESLLRFLYI